MDTSPKLTRGSASGALFRMAMPMLAGTFALNAFNLTDTWFVAQLGNQTHSVLPLAAMGFTFPVVLFILFSVRGIGTGATAVIASAIGRGDFPEAKRVTTHALLLILSAVVIFGAAGLLSIGPLFRMLGADDEVMPLIREYMVIWHLGVPVLLLPMMSGDIIRATGDTIRPSMLMFFGCMLNLVLDPIMIFGYLGCPPMGIAGAALATVISRAVTCIGVIYVLVKCHGLLDFHVPGWTQVRNSWKRILGIGLPAGLSNLLMPIAGGIITRMVTHYGGREAVAACAAGSRLEMFAFMVPMCVGISLLPFASQNLGAGRLDRVKEAARSSMIFGFLFGLGAFVVFFLSAPYMAALFVKTPEARHILVLYLRIIAIGYGAVEVHRYSSMLLNGIHKPLHATGLNALRIVVLLVPLSYLGAEALDSVAGLFWGRLAADLASGGIGVYWFGRVLRRISHEAEEA